MEQYENAHPRSLFSFCERIHGTPIRAFYLIIKHTFILFIIYFKRVITYFFVDHLTVNLLAETDQKMLLLITHTIYGMLKTDLIAT